jgi:fatty acid desaturase
VYLPLDRQNGTRELGLGFWGLLLGGGPWGQPCHACHHLEPALAWYQQLALHLTLRRILAPAQRRQLFLQPVIGFPKLLWQVASPLK